jgi:hypothetical protein
MRASWKWSVLAVFMTACTHKLEGPAPTITALEPPLVCNIVRTRVMLTGTGLSPLAIDALTDDPRLKLPEISMQRVDASGNPMGAAVVIPDDPHDPASSDVEWHSQTSMDFHVDPSLMLPAGTYRVTVTNGNGHAFTSTIQLTVVEPPELTSITPQVSCPQGGAVVIRGTKLAPTASATIGGQVLTTDMVSADGTTLNATLGPGLDPGTHDVVVDNGGGCIDTLEDAFVVTPGVAVFFVDPTVVYSGINTQANVFVSGLINMPVSVNIAPTGGGASRPITFNWSASRPNRIQATIPSGLAAGPWDLTVMDGTCSATLSPAFSITDTLTVAIAGIEPPFGRTDDDTAVSITAVTPPPSGQVQFMQTPRAFLNPDTGAATAVANQLVAVSFVDATRLTAIVPEGIPAGVYDLIVVNPDGTVGLLDKAFTVTPVAAPPPTITAITPGSVVNDPGQAVTLTGTAFRAGADVQATCELDSGGTMVVGGTAVSVSGGTSVTATFDMGALSPAVCVLRVTNTDGTFADFSALAVTLPSLNVPATVGDDAMMTPRRALAAAAGRVTALARFLYAIGGDDGTDAGRLASIEVAPVDPFGRLSGWARLPADLPEARSFSTAVTIGRFLYLVGGRTTAGATDSVLRAQILDPRAVPEITDVGFEPLDDGVDPGLYYYRVSAVMAGTNASNPGGETLPSDPISIVVPTAGSRQVRLTLFWSAVPGAASYRVYRSPTAGGRLEDIRLIADNVTATQLADVGAPAVSPERRHLEPGALGTWHEIGSLTKAREGAGVTYAADPDTANGFFLYAIGGRDGTNPAFNDYDVAAVTVAGDGSQMVGDFRSGGALLAAGRWQLGALAMDHERAEVVPEGQTWIYAMAGLDAAGTGVLGDVTAARVGGDGTLGSIEEVADFSPALGGYAYAGANGTLYAFGGSQGGGVARSNAISSAMCPGAQGCSGGTTVPDLRNWNALGFSLTQERYLPGSALESAFIFIVGGASGTQAATATVERTHW